MLEIDQDLQADVPELSSREVVTSCEQEQVTMPEAQVALVTAVTETEPKADSGADAGVQLAVGPIYVVATQPTSSKTAAGVLDNSGCSCPDVLSETQKCRRPLQVAMHEYQ